MAGEDVLAMKPGRLRCSMGGGRGRVQGAQHVLNPVRRVAHQIQEAIDVHRGSSKVVDLLSRSNL
jgi:ABC-type dipeptide/oligopeptide/nickel transport system ATPase component